MRVVLDANQFVSAVLVPVGHPAQILAAWRRGELDLLVSPPSSRKYAASCFTHASNVGTAGTRPR